MWDCGGGVKYVGITVDADLAYPAVPHPRYVAAGICQGSCLGKVNDSDVHGLLSGPDDALGLPIHYGQIVKCDGVTCCVGMVKDGGGGPKVFPVPIPKVSTSFTNILHCSS